MLPRSPDISHGFLSLLRSGPFVSVALRYHMYIRPSTTFRPWGPSYHTSRQQLFAPSSVALCYVPSATFLAPFVNWPLHMYSVRPVSNFLYGYVLYNTYLSAAALRIFIGVQISLTPKTILHRLTDISPTMNTVASDTMLCVPTDELRVHRRGVFSGEYIECCGLG